MSPSRQRPPAPRPLLLLPRLRARVIRGFARAAACAILGIAVSVWSLLGVTPAAAQGSKRVVHNWKRIYYGTLDGKESLLFADRIERAKPAFGDIDGDGDLDLLLGVASGRIMVFEHGGGGGYSPWHLVNEALRASASSQEQPDGAVGSVVIDVGENAAPAFADIDADDDLDLFVGGADGKLRFYRNEGNRYLPQFFLANPDVLGHPFGGNLVPKFGDIDGDGIADLVLGNERGEVFVLRNRGTRFEPNFCLDPAEPRRDCPAPPEPLARLEEADNAAPDWVDWDRDGDLDLMVGKSDGRIAYYRNIGTRFEGAWELAADRFLILDVGGYAAPLFHDFDGDGWADLFLAGDSETIPFYRNRPEGNRPDLWLVERNTLQVRRLGRFQRRLRLTSGDLDNDGDADLILGTGGGQLLVYDNDSPGGSNGGEGSVAFRSHVEPLLPTPKRAFSAPALADVDGDGDLDLLLGDRNGRLELIRNAGSRLAPAWRSASLFFARIDVGSMSVPVLSDVDGDGDLDLLVGNSLGNVIYYQNDGDARAANYGLRSVRFGGLKVGGHASPAIFPWNPEGAPDLVTGAGSGQLFSAVRNEAISIEAQNAWLPEGPAWRGIRAEGYSAPHFVDLTGDGRPDLLMGTGEGTLALWRYEGSLPLDQLARAQRPRVSNALPEGAEAQGFVFEQEGRESTAAISNDLEERSGVSVRQRRDLPQDPIFQPENSAIAALPTGRNSFPAFADLNGDGSPDLLVGTAAGKLFHFANGGPKENPEWRLVTEAFAEYAHGRNAAPVFHDVDGDGDPDLAVGNESGRVSYWENLGPPAAPEFRHRPEGLKAVKVGKNAVPVFADLDGDGTAELLVGNLKGSIFLYRRNAGGGPLDYALVERRFVGVDAGINATPSLADITIDRRPELLVGSDQGAIFVFQRTGTSPYYSSGWKRNDTFFAGLKFPPGSHPAVADLDGDGDADLYVGSDKGPIRFFRNHALVPEGGENLTGALTR